MLTEVTDDEREIRETVDAWMAATKAGDTAAVLDLMTDDVLFLTPGKDPFGKGEFRARLDSIGEGQLDASSDIQEVHVNGDWAWMRNRLDVTMTPPSGEPVKRSGHTLTILQKGSDRRWRIARDANLLPPGGG